MRYKPLTNVQPLLREDATQEQIMVFLAGTMVYLSGDNGIDHNEAHYRLSCIGHALIGLDFERVERKVGAFKVLLDDGAIWLG